MRQDADDYEGKVAHVELAKKMRKRDPATAPTTGDRVPFVIIKVSGNTANWLLVGLAEPCIILFIMSLP